jgi:hypothetical protein
MDTHYTFERRVAQYQQDRRQEAATERRLRTRFSQEPLTAGPRAGAAGWSQAWQRLVRPVAGMAKRLARA